MAEVNGRTKWKEPASGLVHWLSLNGITEQRDLRLIREAITDCGVSVTGLMHVTELALKDEPVTCGRCLERDGEPAIRMAEYVIAAARRAVSA